MSKKKDDYEIKLACGWIFFISKYANMLNPECTGKWMYFYHKSLQMTVEDICMKAIKEKACLECKCTDTNLTGEESGVICFYTNADNLKHHKKILQFMLENKLIPRRKNGFYYNISFKLDEQTKLGRYGKDFEVTLRLSDFCDLLTGEFIGEI